MDDLVGKDVLVRATQLDRVHDGLVTVSFGRETDKYGPVMLVVSVSDVVRLEPVDTSRVRVGDSITIYGTVVVTHTGDRHYLEYEADGMTHYVDHGMVVAHEPKRSQLEEPPDSAPVLMARFNQLSAEERVEVLRKGMNQQKVGTQS